MFVRHDSHRGALQRVYDGPFRVLERNTKTFVLDIGGRRETISIDRLKRAHEDPAVPLIPAQPPRRGRPPAPKPPRLNNNSEVARGECGSLGGAV